MHDTWQILYIIYPPRCGMLSVRCWQPILSSEIKPPLRATEGERRKKVDSVLQSFGVSRNPTVERRSTDRPAKMPPAAEMFSTPQTHYSTERMGRMSQRGEFGSSVPSVHDIKFRKPTRDSSLGGSFRLSRRDSFTASTSSGIAVIPSSPIPSRRSNASTNNRIRDSAAVAIGSPSMNRRNSTVVAVGGLGAETAKYKREESIREIKQSFEHQFQETQKKMRGVLTDDEKLTRSRAKIIGLTSASMGPTWDCYSDMEKRHCVSDMYTDTKHFSSTTMSAIGNISEHAKYKKKSDYTWRKDMEDFESREQRIRDIRSRSIGGIARKRKEATPTSEVNSAADTESPIAAARRPPLPVTASASAADDTKAKKGRKEVTFGSESRDKGQRRERSLNELLPPPAPERRSGSGRERRRADREDAKKAAGAATTTTTTTSKVRDECGDAAPVAAGGESVPGANSDNGKSVAVEGEEEKKKEEEEEDVHGTKKLRSDFHGMMGSLEEEMEAGKNKLAKLRAKIRKARTAIKAADEAMKAEEEERRQKKS